MRVVRFVRQGLLDVSSPGIDTGSVAELDIPFVRSSSGRRWGSRTDDQQAKTRTDQRRPAIVAVSSPAPSDDGRRFVRKFAEQVRDWPSQTGQKTCNPGCGAIPPSKADRVKLYQVSWHAARLATGRGRWAPHA